jgi:Holliday junction resolvasome RuvABC endonuclease subunit
MLGDFVSPAFIGVDPSSTKTGLVAVQEDGFAMRAATFVAVYGKSKKPEDVTKDISENLIRFESFFLSFVEGLNIKAAVVERLSVAHNMNTVRRIAYFEGAALASLAATMVPIIAQTNVSTARAHVFGKGVAKAKTDVVRIVRGWGGVYEQLTEDECDALVMARYAAIRYGASTT